MTGRWYKLQRSEEIESEPIHQIVPPKEGIAGETSEWRAAKPVLNEEKCTSCNNCWLYCPDTCIDMVDGLPVIDYTYCKGCMVCVSVCPTKALEEVSEGEVTF